MIVLLQLLVEKRSRYAKIYILIIAVVGIAFGVVFVTESQGSAMPGSKMVLHIHPRLNVKSDGNPVIIPQNIGIGKSLWKDHTIDNYDGM
ncbi:MAG TPA: hypothetical protein VH500_20315 [Nitrososphaeraceae archaeon]|jgi:disulfide bond formation protein DsbB